MRNYFTSFAVPVLAFTTAFATACGGSTGEEGKIQFTALDCGRTGCSFDEPIGVGGRIGLHVFGNEDVSTIGVDVRSSDASKLTVMGIPDFAGRPTWELAAVGAGEVDLEVFRPADGDQGEETIDRLTISTVAVSRIGLENFIGDAVGPGAASGGFDEVWTVNAGAPVSFRATVYDSGDVAAMGRIEYTVTLDQDLTDNLIDRDTSEGRLYVNPPTGSWSATFAGAGLSLAAQIVAE